MDTYIVKKSKKVMKNNNVNGYEMIKLNNKGYLIHRLVAMTFIPTDDYSLYVDHIDQNKLNNNKNNLRWVTQKENIANNNKITSHARKVIQKDLLGNIIAEFDSVTSAGVAIGKCRHAVSKACLKVNQTCGGFIFDYLDNDKHAHQHIDTETGIPIDGYEHYLAFPDGQIYNKMRKSYLEPITNHSGYNYVTLCKNKKKQNFYVHRLIAKAFLQNTDENKTQVNHKNKQRTDNSVDNLEWVSASENIIHAKKI